MDVAATLSAITAALGLAKELKDVDHQLDKADLKLKVAELTSALADAKVGLVEVVDQLRAKDSEISSLIEKLRYRAENLIDHNGFRYQAKDGKVFGAPYCPACEAKGLYIKVAQDRNTAGHPYKCPSCRADFGYNGVYAREA